MSLSELIEKAKFLIEIIHWIDEASMKIPYDHEEWQRRADTRWVSVETLKHWQQELLKKLHDIGFCPKMAVFDEPDYAKCHFDCVECPHDSGVVSVPILKEVLGLEEKP